MFFIHNFEHFWYIIRELGKLYTHYISVSTGNQYSIDEIVINPDDMLVLSNADNTIYKIKGDKFIPVYLLYQAKEG